MQESNEVPVPDIGQEEECKGVAYTAVEGDPVDQLLKKFLASKSTDVSINRVAEGAYHIGDKTLPV